ncbi:MAG TPA: glycosyltransferase, partial [Thermoanaerobaculia bacterium]|nr:glycosyltransferase [Thermoanaerobaculia bacterium]
DFEILVSDNASTDRTAAICEEIAAGDPRIRVIRQEQNRGPFWNFRFVVEPASAPYFLWAAGDDRWHPDFLGRCVAALRERPDVGVVFPSSEIRSLRIPLVRRGGLPHLDFVDSDDVFERVCRYIDLAPSSHKANAIYGLWRTDLVRRTVAAFAGFEPRLAYRGLDIAMMVFVLTQTKMLHLPEVLFYKASKWFPSGSRGDRFFHWTVRTLRSQRVGEEEFRRAWEEHLALIRHALREGGVYDARYEDVLQATARGSAHRGV